MAERFTAGDRVVFRDDADGPVYRVLSIAPSGICRLRHEEGGFDTPPVDVSHLAWVNEWIDARTDGAGGASAGGGA